MSSESEGEVGEKIADISAKNDQAFRASAEQCVKALARQFPKLTQSTFNQLLPPAAHYDANWTPQDESELIQAWQADPEKHTVAARNTALLNLWKICGRFLGCLPTDIISAEYHLEYDTSVGRRGLPRNWPSTFSRPLRALVMHPIWRRNKGLIAMAIQYAVIVRTGDRRKWPLENHTLDLFFDQFILAIAADQDDLRIEVIHRKVREELKRKYPTKCLPLWTDLLRAIERKTPHDKEEIGIQLSSDPFEPYKVKKTDIENVITALDSISNYEFPVYTQTEILDSVVQTTRLGRDPPSEKTLPRLREIVVLSERREAGRTKNALARRLAALNQEEEDGPLDVQEAVEPLGVEETEAPPDAEASTDAQAPPDSEALPDAEVAPDAEAADDPVGMEEVDGHTFMDSLENASPSQIPGTGPRTAGDTLQIPSPVPEEPVQMGPPSVTRRGVRSKLVLDQSHPVSSTAGPLLMDANAKFASSRGKNSDDAMTQSRFLQAAQLPAAEDLAGMRRSGSHMGITNITNQKSQHDY